MRGSNRTAGQGASFSQKPLVVCQAALSLVLIAGAILLTQSLRKLEQQHFGFQIDHRYVVHVGEAFNRFPADKLPGTYRELQARLSALPGVITASYSLYGPMSGDNWSGPIFLPGRTPNFGDHGDFSPWLRVSPNYFETVGTRLLPTSGRAALLLHPDHEESMERGRVLIRRGVLLCHRGASRECDAIGSGPSR